MFKELLPAYLHDILSNYDNDASVPKYYNNSIITYYLA